jgi:hypothetical protein
MKVKILLAAALTALVAVAVPSLSAASERPASTPTFSSSSVLAAPSLAATGCTSSGPTVTDWTGTRFATRYCHNYKAGPVGFGTTTTGYLYAGTNWFVCQERSIENPPVGNARNNVWLYTQGDVSYVAKYHGWGWFPATYVSGGGNYEPIPGLRWC